MWRRRRSGKEWIPFKEREEEESFQRKSCTTFPDMFICQIFIVSAYHHQRSDNAVWEERIFCCVCRICICFAFAAVKGTWNIHLWILEGNCSLLLLPQGRRSGTRRRGGGNEQVNENNSRFQKILWKWIIRCHSFDKNKHDILGTSPLNFDTSISGSEHFTKH